MKKLFTVLAAIFLLILIVCSGGCSSSSGSDDSSGASSDTSSAKAITAFSLNGVEGTINETAKTIAVIMPSGTNVTNLVAEFEATGEVDIEGVGQVSGYMINDFTNPVIYTVTAENGSKQNYTVTVTITSSSEPQSSAKAITAYSLGGVGGTINQTVKTIAVNLPLGTDVTAMVATFTTTGVSVKVGSVVQASGQTPNDFTNPVVYTVTAADATTQDYIVTVTIGDVNQTATAIRVSISPNNPSTATSSITGSYTVTDPDGGTVILTEWYDNGVLRQNNTKTLANGVTSGTDTLSGGFSLSHTITFRATADDAVSGSTSAMVTANSSANDYTSAHIGTLKYVPAGSFQRDGTASNISTVSAFRMSQYDITRAQFVAIMGADPSYTPYSSGTSDPVQTVTWYDAVAFCNKLSIAEGLTPVYTITARTPATGYPITDATVTPTWSNNGYRLPTEMEWMWAAMGASSDGIGADIVGGVNTGGYTKGYAGSIEAGGAQVNIGDYAWTGGNSAGTTHPVGTKLPNELGLYDMSGNVWEWCWDWYRDNGTWSYYAIIGAVTDYRGTASGTARVYRGGAWNGNASDATVAYRLYSSPDIRYINVGFRVVRN